ncbi:MAG: phosphatase PAP2 family protein [Candidatus Andersenbacteria bacterium]
MLQSLLYYLQFGQAHFLLIFFVVLIEYLCWKMGTQLVEFYFFKDSSARAKARRVLAATLRLTALLLILFFLIGIGIETINTYPDTRADITTHNHTLMEADRMLFGTYPPLWLQATTNPWKPWFDTTAPLLLVAYNSLSVVLGLMLIFLAVVNGRLFAQMFAVFILSLLLSMPLWYLYPALSPLEGYVHPVGTPIISGEVATLLAHYQPNPRLDKFLERILALRAQDDERFLAVTTIPSMHVAWVTAVVYHGWRAWRPLLAIGLPYLLLNYVATVYTLQHYAVDSLAGLLIALVAIGLTAQLRLDRLPDVRVVLDVIHDDIVQLRRWFSGKLHY